nr:hypothetical protein [uncultured Cohaesibacter sp.]
MYKPIVKVIEVPTDILTAYRLFSVGMGSWWPLDTRSISIHSTGVAAKALETDPVPGGAIIEIASDDTRHVWGNFTDCDEPNSLAINFHMGQPLDHSTQLVVSFILMAPERTLVKLVHGGWDCFGALASMMRDGYDKGWDEIFVFHYAHCCEKSRYLRRA